ncbi:16S rRNA (uracil(1498)-N(3))-methyltransferase, partial [Geoalkalibacter sp.]|uniref:16S rRNA (uracil(1498)-N(3))-methyltransferase n=1 Tax=Geoalkalibacter sp. TaxID=3041440 RepID=UPI00272DD06A
MIQLREVAELGRHCVLSDAARAALACWQPRLGEALTVSDAQGRGFRARVLELDAHRAVLLPFESLALSPESSVRIEVFQALPQRERFELILQKLTEIGVARIVPYESQR